MNIDLIEIGVLAKFLSEAMLELDRLIIENRKQTKLLKEQEEQLKKQNHLISDLEKKVKNLKRKNKS